jgi:hypothetical protein
MEIILSAVCGCIGQGCCWYNVFRCCGCIDDGTGHVNLDRQVINTKPTGNSKDDNPFVPVAPPPPAKYKADPNPFT